MNILVFAPHPDDEILGCGGVIAKRVKSGDNVFICTVTKGCGPIFTAEAVRRVRNEQQQAHKILGIKENYYLDFPAVDLESVKRCELNVAILNIIKKTKPTIVYIPHFGDMQKDHLVVAESVMVAVRPREGNSVKKILSYETLSETEWNISHSSVVFIPNVFEDISTELEQKLEAISCMQSQLGPFPNPRSVEAVANLAKVRGAQMGEKAAEAFCLIKEYC